MRHLLTGLTARQPFARAFLATAALIVSACSASTDGSGAPAPAPAPTPAPPPTGSTISSNEAARFLTQATFGPTSQSISELQQLGYEGWLTAEFAKPQEALLTQVLQAASAGEDVGPEQLAETFWTRSIASDDQLRQRVGYALSQIIVASYADTEIAGRPVAMANYMDIMAAGAFGNFRQTLENVTYSPAMAIYLTYLQNQRADAAREVVPDENYAREIMQLFTIGLIELQPNGEPRLDGGGAVIETYDNVDVTELAKVFTGLSWAERDRFLGKPSSLRSEYLPLEMYDEEHSPEAKSFLGTTIPANTSGTRSISLALDTLFNHPNTAPFISKQLIQRLVTSNPSPDYVGRVAAAFASGSYTMPGGRVAGGGGRGDMRAVVAAVLLDPEARNLARMSDPDFGKIREPVIRFTNWARAFNVTRTDTADATPLRDTQLPNRLAQQAYRSPSVFNFYRPGFAAPGSQSAAAGLVAPELQITTASSVTGYANFMEEFVTRGPSQVNYVPDYSGAVSRAGDAAALVDYLDDLLAYGSLSSVTRNRVISAVNAVSSGAGGFTRDETRVQAAVLFILTSSDFIIAR